MKQTLFRAFVFSALAFSSLAQTPSADAKVQQPKAAYLVVDAYPIKTCVVSGHALDPKTASSIQAGGRSFKVCSAECAAKLAAQPSEYVKKLDAATIAAQQPLYALETCPISKEKIEQGKATEALIDGTLVRLCCPKCVAKAEGKRAEVLGMVRDAAYAAQIKTYSADKCPVSGHELKKGEAVDVLLGLRLVRVACLGCFDKLRLDPEKALSEQSASASCCGDGAKKDGACCGDGEKKEGSCCSDGAKKEGACCDEKADPKKGEARQPEAKKEK